LEILDKKEYTNDCPITYRKRRVTGKIKKYKIAIDNTLKQQQSGLRTANHAASKN